MSEQENLFRQLQSRIRVIVHENSGGLKMTKLVTELACQEMVGGETLQTTVEDVERAIDEDPTLNAHDYVWHMSEAECPSRDLADVAATRAKVFVHEV